MNRSTTPDSMHTVSPEGYNEPGDLGVNTTTRTPTNVNGQELAARWRSFQRQMDRQLGKDQNMIPDILALHEKLQNNRKKKRMNK